MKKLAGMLLLLILVAVPVTAAAFSPQSASTVAGLTLRYYRSYTSMVQTFNSTYQKAVQVGVDNQTLSKALALYENATKEIAVAKNLSNGGCILASLGDYFVFLHVRLAYVDITNAINLLQNAIAARENGS
ncbi:hypothetical protein [Thermococcus prieurii]